MQRSGRRVSPGLRSRPSLSGVIRSTCASLARGVAGTTVPAFVERGDTIYMRILGAWCRRDYGPGLR